MNGPRDVCIDIANRDCLVFRDVLNYNDVIFAADSYESVKDIRFTDMQTVEILLSNLLMLEFFGTPLVKLCTSITQCSPRRFLGSFSGCR